MKHLFFYTVVGIVCGLFAFRPLAAGECQLFEQSKCEAVEQQLFEQSECEAVEQQPFEQAVREAVERQMRLYPRSTLKDLYKNFFQDRFGPGHLVADTAAAGRYLRRELASYTTCEGPAAEPTGWQGNFYRVNLSVIKQGRISYDRFFDAFVRSVNSIRPVPLSRWQEEWEKIEVVIRRLYPDLPGYEADRLEIEQRLAAGEYVGHHSREFEISYSPHYRIISREIYEKEIKSLTAD